MEVILRYIRNVSSLKKIQLKNHKNRTKNTCSFFMKLFLSQRIQQRHSVKDIYRTTFGIQTKENEHCT